MAQDQLERYLSDLEREHCNDRDGGYGLVHSVTELLDSQDNVGKDLLVSLLLGYVSAQDSLWRGVALEVLVRRPSVFIANKLLELLRAAGPGEWRQKILLSLLRIGDLRAVAEGASDLEKMRHEGQLVFILFLAQIVRLYPALTLSWGSEFLAKVLSTSSGEKGVKGYVPGLVVAFVGVEPSLLKGLVMAIQVINPDAALRFSDLVRQYLDEKWALRGIDRSIVEGLRNDFSL